MAQSSTLSDIKNKVSETASGEPHEGSFTRKVERQTAKVPSLGFLGLAVGSMIGSAAIALFAERKEFANFVGLWAPSFLLIGIYNKIVKLEEERSHGSA